MAQTTQIVPKFSFPYVETVTNDYTEVSSTTASTSTGTEVVKYLFPFTSAQGIDNVYVRKSDYDSFVSTYGTSNYKKYGQPLMMPLALLSNGNAEVWCMRVMPENAAYSHSIISLYYKADTAEEVANASDRKFRIKFTQKSADDMTTVELLKTAGASFDGVTVKQDGETVYKDAEGYLQKPIAVLRSNGRGTYGDNYRVRMTQNTTYEKEYGIKMYTFEVLTTTSGLTKVASYVGSIVTSEKYSNATLINDILEDTATGVAPVDIAFDEDNFLDVYEAYMAFCKQQAIDLADEYETKLADSGVTSGMLDGTETIPTDKVSAVAELNEIQALIDACDEDSLPDEDQFDPIFGTAVAATTAQPFIYFPTTLTSSVDTTAEGYVALNYTATTDLVDFDATQGVALAKGGNGYFDAPRTSEGSDGEPVQNTYDDEVEICYNAAFDGTYDKRILSSRRLQADALFDANYPYSVKCTMADLAIMRNDAIAYLDTGIVNTLSSSALKSLIADYSVFNDKLVSKNLHHYTVREPGRNKRIDVTITYFLAQQYCTHMLEVGSEYPFVKSYAQLSGHIKDSLAPSIEEYETSLKETLYENRFNYFETIDDNVYQRATQNTSQVIDSDLLEESNVTILCTLKREIEKDIQGELYNFAEDDIRNSFRKLELAKYSSYVGSKVQSMDIEFKANEFEAEHSILHAYLVIVFRGLQKRSILEIDINQREYTASTNDEE